MQNPENANKVIKPEKPRPTILTAWFTTQIPVSFGPNGVWGLPGLVLEYSNNSVIYLCTSIKIKQNEKVKIKQPNKGKIVSVEEFKKIEEKAELILEERKTKK